MPVRVSLHLLLFSENMRANIACCRAFVQALMLAQQQQVNLVRLLYERMQQCCVIVTRGNFTLALLFTAITIIMTTKKEQNRKNELVHPLLPFRPKAPPTRSGGSSFRYANLSNHLVQSMHATPSTLIFFAFLAVPPKLGASQSLLVQQKNQVKHQSLLPWSHYHIHRGQAMLNKTGQIQTRENSRKPCKRRRSVKPLVVSCAFGSTKSKPSKVLQESQGAKLEQKNSLEKKKQRRTLYDDDKKKSLESATPRHREQSTSATECSPSPQ